MPLSPPAKRRIAAIVTVLGLFAIARVTFFRGLDDAVWQETAAEQAWHGGDVRRSMYLDIRLFGRLKGLSREEVIGTIGPSCTTHNVRGHDMVYGMGVDRTLQHHWLALDFEDGVVARVGRVRGA